MIKTKIVKAKDKPVVVVMDYREYLRLKEIEEDRESYHSVLRLRTKNKKWKTREEMKKNLTYSTGTSIPH